MLKWKDESVSATYSRFKVLFFQTWFEWMGLHFFLNNSPVYFFDVQLQFSCRNILDRDNNRQIIVLEFSPT